MNPLEWKRERQVALICAVALGGLIGAILGLFYLNPNPHFETCDVVPTGFVWSSTYRFVGSFGEL